MSGSPSEPAETPAQRRPSRFRRVLAAIGALGVLGGVGALAAAALGAIYAAAQMDGVEPTPPLPVATERIEIVDAYETTESYIGRVEPARTTALGFEIGGEVVAVLIEEGVYVLENQVIARLDVASLEARRAQLVAEKERLEADLALARRTRARQDRLSGDGFASEQRADEARTAETTTTAAIAAIDARLRMVDIDIRKATIRAPFAGVVAARGVDEGAIVAPGQMVAELLESDRPQARIGLPPERAERLVIGDRYEIALRGRPTPATLTRIRPDLDPATRTVAAIFDLDLATGGSRAFAAASGAAGRAPVVAPFGEVARLELSLEVSARGAWVPLSALQEDAKGLWRILVIAENDAGEPVVAAENVEALYVAGERAFVAGAIADEAEYLTEGVNRVVIGDVVAPSLGE